MYSPKSDGPDSQYLRLPGPKELGPAEDTSIFLEVGPILGDNPGKYLPKGNQARDLATWETARRKTIKAENKFLFPDIWKSIDNWDKLGVKERGEESVKESLEEAVASHRDPGPIDAMLIALNRPRGNPFQEAGANFVFGHAVETFPVLDNSPFEVRAHDFGLFARSHTLVQAGPEEFDKSVPQRIVIV
ncbi:hypothetical protein PspLS_03408 [Pyricularia sp. CBS 133598]|nr:hypothetical protein PspLS_03408 [Pyricularia sp. CBS 133598]